MFCKNVLVLNHFFHIFYAQWLLKYCNRHRHILYFSFINLFLIRSGNSLIEPLQKFIILLLNRNCNVIPLCNNSKPLTCERKYGKKVTNVWGKHVKWFERDKCSIKNVHEFRKQFIATMTLQCHFDYSLTADLWHHFLSVLFSPVFGFQEQNDGY